MALQIVSGEITHTTLGSFSQQGIMEGGIAHSTTISGLEVTQFIMSGGVASHTTLDGEGSDEAKQNVEEGGIAHDTIVNLYGKQAVEGGLAYGTIVNSGGVQTVSDGGSAFNVRQNVGGNIEVEVTGGDSTYVSGTNASGNAFTLSNGVASNFILHGEQNVQGGGLAVETLIEAGGKQEIGNGGLASSTRIHSQGEQEIRSGGSAVNTHIEAGGNQIVQYGGTANSTTVSSGGRQEIQEFKDYSNSHFGGSSLNVIQEEGGNIDVSVTSGGKAYVSGTNASGSALTLENGVASNFIVYAGGRHTVSAGGSSLNLTQKEGGNIDVEVSPNGGAYVSGLNASGSALTLENGVASNFIVYSGGKHTVNAGGSSLDVIQHEGGNIEVEVSSGGAYVSGINASGSALTLSGGVASNFILYAGGTQNVGNGGLAVNTIVHSGGVQTVNSGGSSVDVTQMSGGNIFFGEGDDIYISGINALGSTFTYSGNTASNFIVYGEEGGGTATQTINSGVSAYNTILVGVGGRQDVRNGGFAFGTVIHEGGTQSIHSGGTASGTTISAGGTIEIDNMRQAGGGSALGILQHSGGRITLAVSGGDPSVVTGTHDPDKKSFSYSNGVASNFVLYEEGYLQVLSGGLAISTVLHEGGYLSISSGGSASGTTVHSDGYQTVETGGWAADTTVSSGGSLQIANSSILAGSNYLAEGSILFFNGAAWDSAVVILQDSNTVLHLERDSDDTLGMGFTGSGGLVKTGSGRLTLIGDSDYTGGTVVGGGAIIAGNDSAFGASAVTMHSGTSLGFVGNHSLANPFTLSGGVTINTYGYSATLSGILDGGTLTKIGSGYLALAGTNTYSGGTIISGGTLAGSLTSGGNLTIAAGATYDGTDSARFLGALSGAGAVMNSASLSIESGNFAGVISGGGTLLKAGSGSLTLAGAVSQGDIMLTSGTMSVVEGGSLFASGAFTAASGTTLGLTVGNDSTASAALQAGSAVISGGAVNLLNYNGSGKRLLVHTTSGISGNFGQFLNSGSAMGGSLDPSSAGSYQTIFGAVSGTDLWVEQTLTWERGTSAHGTFNVTDSFTVESDLADNTSGATHSAWWDGKRLTKTNSGSLILAGANTYTGDTVVSGGSLAITGTLDNDLTSAFVYSGGITNLAALTFANSTSGLEQVLAGALTGNGTLVKEGESKLILNAPANSAGTVAVNAGQFIVGGTSAHSAVTLTAPGGVEVRGSDNILARLGGHGIIDGAVIVHSGGILSPGNSIGRLKVTKSVTFKSGSFFDVEIDLSQPGVGDRLEITGSATLAGTVRVTGYGDYAEGEDDKWLILSATEGFNGTTFGNDNDKEVVMEGSGIADLSPRLRYEDEYDGNGNPVGEGGSGDGTADTLYLYFGAGGSIDLVDPDDLDRKRSGELHATLKGTLLKSSDTFTRRLLRHVGRRSAAFSPADTDTSGKRLWIHVNQATTTAEGNRNAARARAHGAEVAFGQDIDLADGGLGGFALRFGSGELEVKNRRSEAELTTGTIALYGGKELPLDSGALRFLLTGALDWHKVDSERNDSGNRKLKAHYNGHTLTGAFETAYRFRPTETLSLEPYAALTRQHLSLDGFTEKGGSSAALQKKKESENHTLSTLGVRLSTPLDKARVTFDADLGWQHLFGSPTPKARFEGSDKFTISGADRNRDAALLALNLGVKLTPNTQLRLQYDGEWGKQEKSHGGSVVLEVKW